jgi:hypothetical protein
MAFGYAAFEMAVATEDRPSRENWQAGVARTDRWIGEVYRRINGPSGSPGKMICR